VCVCVCVSELALSLRDKSLNHQMLEQLIELRKQEMYRLLGTA